MLCSIVAVLHPPRMAAAPTPVVVMDSPLDYVADLLPLLPPAAGDLEAVTLRRDAVITTRYTTYQQHHLHVYAWPSLRETRESKTAASIRRARFLTKAEKEARGIQ